MSERSRKSGKLDSDDINSYKRFKKFPKNITTSFLYRGDTRPPDIIRDNTKGFFPQVGRADVSTGDINAGASTAMVCGTLDPSLAATYYSLRKYFNAKNPECNAKNFMGNGYIYAFYVPMGRGILNYELAKLYHSNNVGSLEVSTLSVHWSHIIGWRQLPTQDECKHAAGLIGGIIPWASAFTPNPQYVGGLNFANAEERQRYEDFSTSDILLVYNGSAL